MPPRHAAFPTRCTHLSTQAPAQTRPADSDTRPPSVLKRSSLRKLRYRLLRHIITLRSSVLEPRYGMKFSLVSSLPASQIKSKISLSISLKVTPFSSTVKLIIQLLCILRCKINTKSSLYDWEGVSASSFFLCQLKFYSKISQL